MDTCGINLKKDLLELNIHYASEPLVHTGVDIPILLYRMDFILSIGSDLIPKQLEPAKFICKRSLESCRDISKDELSKFEDYGLQIDQIFQEDACALFQETKILNQGNWSD